MQPWKGGKMLCFVKSCFPVTLLAESCKLLRNYPEPEITYTRPGPRRMVTLPVDVPFRYGGLQAVYQRGFPHSLYSFHKNILHDPSPIPFFMSCRHSPPLILPPLILPPLLQTVSLLSLIRYHNPTDNVSISTPSKARSHSFLSNPPAYPVRLPSDPTTRWQGTMMEISLCPTAPPTACADMRESPLCPATFFANSP